jgi:urease accessory protein
MATTVEAKEIPLAPTLTTVGERGCACTGFPPQSGSLSDASAALRLQSWLSPAFPIGAYSYSHGLEWAVEAGMVRDRASLIDWLDADLRFGSGRNEGIFFCESWRLASNDKTAELVELARLAAAFRGTSEFALEASQQGSACLSIIQRAWPSDRLDAFGEALRAAGVSITLSVGLGAACGAQTIGLQLAVPLFLQSTIANLATAAVRLIPLGQSDGQRSLAALERAVAEAGTAALSSTLDDLGSAAFMLDLASMSHETQYSRLFRS